MIYLLFSLIGLFLGSFLGVVVDRLHNKTSFITGRSICDNCKHKLGILDLIPVISFLLFQGKCRYCHKQISYFYPVIEIVTGLLFGLISFYFITSPLLLTVYLIISGLLIVLIFSDFKYGEIPDFVNLFLIILAIINALITNDHLNKGLTGLFTFAFFFLISFTFYYLTKKNGMGGGDIKYSLFMGLILGFPLILVGLYLAFLTAAACSIILVVWKKKSIQTTKIPFGPFLASGTIIALIWGEIIWKIALKTLGI